MIAETKLNYEKGPMRFIGRDRELELLDTLYRNRGAALLVLYGRRRVGKTSLLSHWIESRQRPHALFWTATTHSAVYQLRDFSQTLMRFDTRFGNSPTEDFTFGDWEAAFDHLADMTARHSGPLVVVIDEFTHLLQTDPALVSVLQKVWDHRFSKLPNLRLMVTGSLIGMIERDVLSIRAPLYGRATTLLKLRPLPFGLLKDVFPKASAAERVAIHGICGGIPAYLDLFARAGSFSEGLKSSLMPGSLMLSDPLLLLHDQLKEPYVYESVLASLASGFHVWNEIAQMAGIAEGSLGFYLKGLQALELIERRDPILTSPAGRRGRYYIRDPFLRFYYRFILRNITLIERGDLGPVVKRINEDLRSYLGGYVFEELCREWMWAASTLGKLGFTPESVGSFWAQQRKQAVQLDVVAANGREKQLFIGEAKWGTGSLSRNTLTDLVERSQRMPQVTEPGWKVQYGLFAREDFTPATVQAAQEIGAHLVTLPELEKDLGSGAARPPDEWVSEIEF